MADIKNIVEEIKKLKSEKNAVIMAHYYQSADIQDIADYIGDSLALAQWAAKTDADIIQGLIQTNATEEKVLVRKELIWKEKFKNQPGKFFNGFLIEQKLNGFLWGKFS